MATFHVRAWVFLSLMSTFSMERSCHPQVKERVVHAYLSQRACFERTAPWSVLKKPTMVGFPKEQVRHAGLSQRKGCACATFSTKKVFTNTLLKKGEVGMPTSVAMAMETGAELEPPCPNVAIAEARPVEFATGYPKSYGFDVVGILSDGVRNLVHGVGERAGC